MSLQTFQETLVASSIAGTSFGSFTTAKTVIPPICLFQMPPNYLYVGKKLRITARGGVGTLVTTPGTIVFQVMVGAVIAYTTGNIQLNATAHTNIPFTLVIDLTCRAIGNGTNANFMGMGTLNGIMFTLTAAQVDGVNSSATMQVPATAPAVGTSFDSTTAQILDFFVGFSINNAANTVKIEDYYVEALN